MLSASVTCLVAARNDAYELLVSLFRLSLTRLMPRFFMAIQTGGQRGRVTAAEMTKARFGRKGQHSLGLAGFLVLGIGVEIGNGVKRLFKLGIGKMIA